MFLTGICLLSRFKKCYRTAKNAYFLEYYHNKNVLVPEFFSVNSAKFSLTYCILNREGGIFIRTLWSICNAHNRGDCLAAKIVDCRSGASVFYFGTRQRIVVVCARSHIHLSWAKMCSSPDTSWVWLFKNAPYTSHLRYADRSVP